MAVKKQEISGKPSSAGLGHRLWLWLIPVALILFILSFMVDEIVLLSTPQFRFPGLTGFMEWVSYLGSTIVIFVVMTSFFLWHEKKREWLPVLWITLLVSWALVFILKIIVSRPRPLGIELVDLGLISFAFPSGHAAIAFCVIPVVNHVWRSSTWFWLVFASLVALSRIYLQVHYLSDVLGGVILGFSIGMFFLLLEKKTGVMRRLRFPTSN